MEGRGRERRKGRGGLLTGMLGRGGGSFDGVGMGLVAAKAFREAMKSAHMHE